MLTQGFIFTNDGSDDSVDAEFSARSKNDIAMTKKSQESSPTKQKRKERLTGGKARAGVLGLLAEQHPSIPAPKRILHLVRAHTTNGKPAPAPRNADARPPSIDVRLHMHLQKHLVGPLGPALPRLGMAQPLRDGQHFRSEREQHVWALWCCRRRS